jgi:molybdenum cofactor biosynthesis protein B
VTLPDGTAAHRAEAGKLGALNCGVLTVSDSRTEATDESGGVIVTAVEKAGHRVAIGDLHAVLITGGTGLGTKDRTVEAVTPLFEKEIPGFGELFRHISFTEQIGTTAILSRAVAGSAKGAAIFSMPGSRAAVELAMTRIIVPELPHLLREIRR